MADFNGNQISNTFKSILNIGESTCFNQELPSAPSQCIVTDGRGNKSALTIGAETAGITVTGNICNNSLIHTTDAIRGQSICTSQGATIGTTVIAAGCVQGNKVCSTGCGIFDDDVIIGDKLTVGNSTGANGHLTVKGTIFGCNDIIAFHTSDKNLKQDLNQIDSNSIVQGLTGYKFNWKEEADRKGADIGILAQDAEKVLPEIVHKRESGSLAVDYIKLVPVLLEEVKRLDNEVKDLKSKLQCQ